MQVDRCRQMQTDAVGLTWEGTEEDVGAAGRRGGAAWASLRRDSVLGLKGSVRVRQAAARAGQRFWQWALSSRTQAVRGTQWILCSAEAEEAGGKVRAGGEEEGKEAR